MKNDRNDRNDHNDRTGRMDETHDVEDQAYLARWQRGDHRAGECLLRRYGPRLLRFFASKGVATPEDLVQLTFIACVQSHQRFRGQGSFAAFLFGIARNELLHFFRAQRHDNAVDFDDAAVIAPSSSPSAKLAGRQQERLVLEALRGLALDDQILLELYYWEGLRGGALAQIFEVPEGTIRTRLLTAKKRLSRKLAECSDKGVASLHSTASRLDDWAQDVAKKGPLAS